MSMGISFLVLGVAFAMVGIGALMDRNASKARERRYGRLPR
jgi:Na+-transporting methylmalonyl-CoA/oxaloacetate decarboxylase gamma subunit